MNTSLLQDYAEEHVRGTDVDSAALAIDATSRYFAGIKASSPNSHQQAMALQSLGEYLAASPPSGSRTIFEGFLSQCADCLQVCTVEVGCKVYELLLGVDLEEYRLRRPAVIRSMWEAIKSTGVDHHFEDVASSVRIKQLVVNAVEWEPYEVSDLLEYIAADCAGWIAGRGLETRVPRRVFAAKLLISLLSHEFMRVSSSNVLRDLTVGSLWEALEHCVDTKLSEGLARLIATLVPLLASEVAHTVKDDLIKAVADRITVSDGRKVLEGFLVLGCVVEMGKIDLGEEMHALAVVHFEKMPTNIPMTGFVLGNLIKSFRRGGFVDESTHIMVNSLIECFRLAVEADNNAPRASRGLSACLKYLSHEEATAVATVIGGFRAEALRYIDIAQVVLLLLTDHREASLSLLIPFIDRVGAECISNHNTTLSTPLWDIVMTIGKYKDGRKALLSTSELGAGCSDLNSSSPVGLLRRGLLLMAAGAIPANYPLAIELLSHEHLEVRRRATLVSLHAMSTLTPSAEGTPLRIDSGIASMTERLLEAGISDPSVSIRRLILFGLNKESCTVYLGLPDHVASVFMAYNDVDAACSDAALEILCRLLAHHPSSIHHGLDRIRTHLLKTVEETNQVVVVLSSVRQLKLMVKSRTFLSAVKQIEMVVVDKLEKKRRPLTHVLIADLFSLLSLCIHNGGTNHVDSAVILKQVLRYAKSGQSSFLRDAALKTLGELLQVHRADSTTTDNSDVYCLLEGIIKDDENQGEKTRHMASDVLGIMGAVHPAKVRRMEQLNEEESLNVSDPLAVLKPPVRTNPRLLEVLPMSCMYFGLMAISSHSDSRDVILTHLWKCLRDTPSSLKVTLIPQVVSLVLPYLSQPNVGNLHASTLQILLDVTPLIRQSAYTAQGASIINALSRVCGPGVGAASNVSLIISLLDELARALPAEEMKHHRWAFHYIMSRLLNDVNDAGLVLAGVRSLESFATLMPVNDLKQAVLQVLECLSFADERDNLGVSGSKDARSLNSTFAEGSLDSTVRSSSGRRADIPSTDDYSGITLVKLTCLDYIDIIITHHSQLSKELSALIVHKLMQFASHQTNETLCTATMNTLASLFALTDKVCRPLMKLVLRQCKESSLLTSTEGCKAIEAFLVNSTPLVDPRSKLTAAPAPEESQKSNREWVIHSKLEDVSHTMVFGELKRMGIHPQHVQALDVHHVDGGCEFMIRFTLSPKGEASCRRFAADIANTTSTFMTALQVSSAKQKKDTMLAVPASFMDPITRIPKAHRRRKEIMWINWLHRSTISLLEASPHAFLRALSPILREHNGLSRGIFPLAVASILKHISFERQRDLMSAFATALPVCPADVQQAIFEMAEFMECERDERTIEVAHPYEDLAIVVQRSTPEDKFGINYDMTKSNKIVVSRLAAGGCGERAGVPLGAELISLNGVAMKSTSELRSAIEGFTSISLVFRRRIPSEVFREQTFISTKTLAQVSTNVGLHAKAIYFNEQLMHKTLLYLASGAGTPEAQAEQTASLYSTVEALIATYQYVGFAMEAKGIVNFLSLLQQRNVVVEDTYSTFDEGSTLEKINWWEDASELYAERMAEDDESLLGAVRCWKSLGEVSNILATSPERLGAMNTELLKDMDAHRADAAFLMGEWEAFDEICESEEVVNRLGPITKAAALIRANKLQSAMNVVTAAKRELFDEFSDAYGDSYVRSYPHLVQIQHLTHLQEVVEYRKTLPERREELRRLWSKRLKQMLPRPEYWRDVVAINSLVLTQEEDFHSRLEVASLALKSRPTGIGAHILLKLLGTSDLSAVDNWRTSNPFLLSAYSHYLYNQGTPELAEKAISGLAQVLGNVHMKEMESENRCAWGDCWLLLGEWSLQRNANRVDALRFLEKAAELNPNSSDAAHFLGRVHQSISASPEYKQDEAQRVSHITAAITSLFAAVRLSENKNSATLNILRVLSLWFANGHHGEVSDVMRHGIQLCPNTVWLRVIPQLVARMGIGSRTARQVLTDLLTRIGEAFPQALIYPLTVGERSGVKSKREVAEKALQGIRASQEDLVKEASQISGELVRMAILWGELWVEGISRAAKVANSHQEIIRILQGLFSQLSTPSSPNETAFVEQYRQHLSAAWNYLNRGDTNSAWSYLKKVYSQLRKTTQDKKLYMSEVSPVLSAMRQSLVAVPGTFRPSGPLTTIASFQSRIAVMPSKQKPRRFGLTGSDGLSYRFLLKGHEDLRLDERVMQFINLVNSIFKNDPTSIDLEYTIPSYSVIPLTDNVGIIGWVENTETVFRLLERRRQEQGVSIYQEVMMIVQKERLANVDDYHKLPKETRIACLDMVMHGSPRNELAKVMWETNPSCELWMDYRKQYAHTAALMSMVGYVLGLGDRHLNNLMLQKGGNLVHIDFGDCFEVAMKRQLYAEAVPFRLTRLMVFALGISGVDGAYRITCENVMSLLRRNKDNLLAILEAFIYDPLINWSGELEDGKEAKPAPASPVTEDAPSTFVDLSCSAPTRRRIIGQAMLTDEWAVLSEFIRKGGEGARRSIVLPRGSESVPLENAIENVRHAVRENNFQLANAWMQQVQKMAPDDCVQSVFEHSIAEKRSLVANSALARVQAKLSGQDFFGTEPPASIADTSMSIAPFFPYAKKGVDSSVALSKSISSVSDSTDEVNKSGATRRSRFANNDTSGRMQPTSSWFEVEINHFKASTWATNTTRDGKSVPVPAEQPLQVKDQVSRLIGEATALENLSEAYLTGWAPFW